MPAKSAAQQKAAGAALSAQRRETPKSQLTGASRQMVESMTEKQLEEFAPPERKGKPEHVGSKEPLAGVEPGLAENADRGRHLLLRRRLGVREAVIEPQILPFILAEL